MHNAELWTHRAPICLLMRWCKDFSPCIKDSTKTQIRAKKSKVLFKLCFICVCYICPFYQKAQYMADIWGECERAEKGMMRDPDEPLPQKQGLISTSHPIKVSLYHFITQPRNLKSDSVRNFVKMKRSVWQEHCNRIYSIRIAQVLWFGGRALFVVTTTMIKSCSGKWPINIYYWGATWTKTTHANI